MRLCAQASLLFALSMGGLYSAAACSKDKTDTSGSDANAPGDAMPTNDASADGPAAAGEVSAYTIVTGLYRYRIVKADAARNVCFTIGLVGTTPNTTRVELPADWNVEYARALQPSTACLPTSTGDATNAVDASNIEGSVAWNGNPSAASFDSVNLTLTFEKPPAWCPASERLSATNVKIQ